MHSKKEIGTLTTVQSDKLAVFEFNIVEGGLSELHESQVAANELTVRKAVIGKITVGKVTAPEYTFLKLPVLYYFFCINNIFKCFMLMDLMLHVWCWSNC